MPLQNRVTLFGELVAVASRGQFMGNRGGRLHRDDRTLGARRWVSRQWICCVTRFKPIDDLPDAAMLALPGEPNSVFALHGESLRRWRPEGYGDPRPRPRGILVDVLTPPSILAALAQGYRPQWHPSAAGLSGRRP